jgi:hypothetical protein
MHEQNLVNNIKTAFMLSEDIVSDEFITSHPNLMWLDEEINYMVYVPIFMVWCLLNKHDEGILVYDHTISALSEFGRCKNRHLNHLNFKFLCNTEQKELVYQFLIWCRSKLSLPYEKQLDRTIKSWALSLKS